MHSGIKTISAGCFGKRRTVRFRQHFQKILSCTLCLRKPSCRTGRRNRDCRRNDDMVMGTSRQPCDKLFFKQLSAEMRVPKGAKPNQTQRNKGHGRHSLLQRNAGDDGRCRLLSVSGTFQTNQRGRRRTAGILPGSIHHAPFPGENLPRDSGTAQHPHQDSGLPHAAGAETAAQRPAALDFHTDEMYGFRALESFPDKTKNLLSPVAPRNTSRTFTQIPSQTSCSTRSFRPAAG